MNFQFTETGCPRTEVITDKSLGTRSFVLEIERSNGSTLRHESHAKGEPFDWDRNETASNLRAMSDELPLSSQGLERLVQVVLGAERATAREIVSACIA